MQKKILVGIVCALAVAGLVGVGLTKATGLFTGVDSARMVYVGPFTSTTDGSVATDAGVKLTDNNPVSGTYDNKADIIEITVTDLGLATGKYGISGELTIPVTSSTSSKAKVSEVITAGATITITGVLDQTISITPGTGEHGEHSVPVVLTGSPKVAFSEGVANINFTVASGPVVGPITGTLKLTGADAISAAQDAIEASPATYNTIAVPAATYVADTTGTTVGVYRAENRTFYLRNSNDSGVAHVEITYGDPGDVALVYNNKITVYRPSTKTFYVDDANDGGITTAVNIISAASYAKDGDVPIASNAGATFVGVYRPSNSTFYLDMNHDGDVDDAGDKTILFGDPGDLPVAVGDGIAVYRPSNKTFYVDSDINGVTDSVNGTYTLAFAQDGDVPVSDGTNVGLYRPSTATFTLRASGTDVSFAYGNPGDTPLFGDWGVGFWLSLEDYYE